VEFGILEILEWEWSKWWHIINATYWDARQAGNHPSSLILPFAQLDAFCSLPSPVKSKSASSAESSANLGHAVGCEQQVSPPVLVGSKLFSRLS